MSTKDPTDYEAMARDMMQQWQDSWKSMLKENPSATAAASGPETEEKKPVEEAPDLMASWQNLMQPALAAQQQLFGQFWQQMAGAAAAPQDKGAQDAADGPDAKRATDVAPEPAKPAQPAATVAPAAAPAAAAPHAGADGNADLARRIDLLSQRLLRCEVELDKLKRAGEQQ